MQEFNLRSIIGDTNQTIEAIQKFIEKDKIEKNNTAEEESPAASINKILNSAIDKEINEAIQQIIDKI